jgi:hypothetical protein
VEYLKNLLESFKETFSRELPVELNEDCPTHIPVGKMIQIVFEASKKAGIESRLVLRHFQFTEEEIGDFLKKSEKAKI